MRRVVPLLVVAAATAAALPASALGQAGSCQLSDSQTLDQRTQGGFRVIHVIAPVVSCTGGARITANEGTIYEASNEVFLSGNVDFRDPERRLTSRQATYSSVTGRLHATGDVVFTDHAEGMTLTGPELEYFRAMPGRPQSQAIATQRPHLTLLPRPRPGEQRAEDSEPIEIDADRMTMTGNDLYTADGRVLINRSDFRATSREARVDQVAERMELRGNAQMAAEQFDLVGQSIDLFLPADRLERIVALDQAELVGDELRIDGHEIQLFFEEDLLQRMFARQGGGGIRPIATARAFRLEADSIEARSPGQQLERVIAIGTARGESLDTLENRPLDGRLQRPTPPGPLTLGDRDWILGDTVIGFFLAVEDAPDGRDISMLEPGEEDVRVAVDPENAPAPAVAPGENGEQPQVQLDRLLAIGTASSLYRVENNDGSRPRPGLNYLVGEAIELSFRDGELAVADVRGLQRGLFLDPEAAPPPGEAPDEPGETPAEPDGGETPPTGPAAVNPPGARR
jgi:lipopolysaccharide export system protein LptA